MLSVLLETFQMMASSMSVETDVHFHCDPLFWSIFAASWFINLNSIFCSLEISFVNIYTIQSFVLYEA